MFRRQPSPSDRKHLWFHLDPERRLTPPAMAGLFPVELGRTWYTCYAGHWNPGRQEGVLLFPPVCLRTSLGHDMYCPSASSSCIQSGALFLLLPCTPIVASQQDRLVGIPQDVKAQPFFLSGKRWLSIRIGGSGFLHFSSRCRELPRTYALRISSPNEQCNQPDPPRSQRLVGCNTRFDVVET